MEEIIHVRRVAYCPHCGNRAPQKLIHKQRYLERAWDSDGGEADPIPWSTFVAACETCHNVLLYDNTADQLEDTDFTSGELIYPNAGQLRSSVPAVIRQIYEEAWRIKELAPNAFSVQIRRALEALCEDRGARGSNLQKRYQI